MRQLMLDREKRYGTFYWRLDGWVEPPCNATNHDHPPGQPYVQQYRHYLDLMREVKEANPEMGLQGCNSGGEWANWDKFELIENNQGSDGAVPMTLLPQLLLAGDQNDAGGGSTMKMRPAQLTKRFFSTAFWAGRRIDRYMRVYHPRADGAPTRTPTSSSPTASAPRWPSSRTTAQIGSGRVSQGLAPQAEYSVAFRFRETRAAFAAEIMREGIRFQPNDAREVILLNLDRTPGRGTDKTASRGASEGIRKWKPGEDAAASRCAGRPATTTA